MNDESEIPGTAAPAPAPEKQVRVLSCMQCESPVVSTAEQCQTCGTALSGDEFPYMPRQAAGPDINSLLKWWVIWCLGVWALAGFSFGIISSFLVSAVSAVYLFRILRAYYH